LIELLTGASFAGVYLAWIALSSYDVWEQAGVPGGLLRLLLVWGLIGAAITLALVAFDTGGVLSPRRAAVRWTNDPAHRPAFEPGAPTEIRPVMAVKAASASSRPTAAACDQVVRGSSRLPVMTAEAPWNVNADLGPSSNRSEGPNVAAVREPSPTSSAG
jgi:hypothetical protein